MKVIVGSKNPVKIEATKKAFSYYFDDVIVIGVSVNSDVSEMPKSEKECILGAKNRINNIKEECDFKVGLEGGMERTEHGDFLMGIAAVTNGIDVSIGSSPRFVLPKKLGDDFFKTQTPDVVADDFFNVEKIGKKQGSVGFFTNGVVDRSKFLELAIIMALTKFIHKKKYESK
ncbi:inosine/xanthosine triphosphatase [archaeon]|jgi:inosine/xanthosine triphosphatase|nr:inosine/xanthosine triphosphatase [archaeon]MBT6820883.1 inosine/xanthosine triphosphatase [archaeon]